jgi:hypothetical protein
MPVHAGAGAGAATRRQQLARRWLRCLGPCAAAGQPSVSVRTRRRARWLAAEGRRQGRQGGRRPDALSCWREGAQRSPWGAQPRPGSSAQGVARCRWGCRRRRAPWCSWAGPAASCRWRPRRVSSAAISHLTLRKLREALSGARLLLLCTCCMTPLAPSLLSPKHARALVYAGNPAATRPTARCGTPPPPGLQASLQRARPLCTRRQRQAWSTSPAPSARGSPSTASPSRRCAPR